MYTVEVQLLRRHGKLAYQPAALGLAGAYLGMRARRKQNRDCDDE
jgi:hypothetical protein